MTADSRSRELVFLPACAICQAFMAQGIVKSGARGMLRPLIEFLADQDVNLVQMPCPETTFQGEEAGLRRAPKGYSQYDTAKFRKHCSTLAKQTAGLAHAFTANGYTVKAVIGIENSPSCAVFGQRSRRGYNPKPGLFIEALRKSLTDLGLSVAMLGVDRKNLEQELPKVAQALGRPCAAQDRGLGPRTTTRLAENGRSVGKTR